MAAVRTIGIAFLRCKHSSRLLQHSKSVVTSNSLRRTLATGGGIFRKKDDGDERSLFVPVPVKISTNPDDINIGEELTSSKLQKVDLLKLLNKFYKEKEVKELAAENGIDNKLFHQASISFRRWCMESEVLPADIHVVFSDVLQGAGHIHDLFSYFLRHARQIFPHLECMDDLRKISDLRLPANWYPEARAINRKIIYHAGPTNSGKTYHALERFITAKSGVYCGPLKLLAVEVHEKCNNRGTPCDLVTGEERRFVRADGTPGSHVACTVEMTSVITPYEVAVIDEIQMLKDPSRGWAWTRALLGAVAEEVHVCGEGAAIELVKSICEQAGEILEVRKYKRLTPLHIENSAVGTVDNIRAGDCIVCFNKNDIFTVSRQLERKGRECAVIYGGLPPGTKLAQAKKFNDPNNPCNILVATDAIGMGLNLSIRRVIFYATIKPTINEKGEKEMDTISTSQALQIGGRAGRYNTQYSEGYVTTFKNDDLNVLKDIMSRPLESIETAGLHPTADQIELFAYHLPHATLSNLIDIFVSLCQVDSSFYFMCNVDTFRFLADMIQHVPLPLRARYVFCCAPINRKMPLVCTMFLKFARQYSKNEVLTFDWLCRNIGWPFSPPRTIMDLLHLETVFDVLDIYLWLGYRFNDLFPDTSMVRDMQLELDSIIQEGVVNIVSLLKATETDHSTGTAAHDEEYIEISRKKDNFQKGQNFQYPEENVPTISMPKPGQSDPEEDSFNANIYAKMVIEGQDAKQKLAKALSAGKGKGRLTDRMIAEGLLSTEQIERLQKEWEQETNRRNHRVNGQMNNIVTRAMTTTKKKKK